MMAAVAARHFACFTLYLTGILLHVFENPASYPGHNVTLVGMLINA